MKLARTLSIVVLCAQFGLGAVNAQSLRNSDEPAEFPPSSYKGTQYVDSRGCAYIRAGIDGLTTWVPRVTRSRKQICNMTPSLGAASAKAAPAKTAPAKAAPTSKPVQQPIRRAQAPMAVRAPMKTIASIQTPPRVMAPTPRRIAVYSAAPASVAQAPVRRTTVAPGRRVVAAPRAPVPSSCSELSPVAQRYMGNSADVRCGPQTEDPVTYATNTRSATTRYTSAQRGNRGTVATVSPNTRVVPRHVYVAHAQAADLVGKIPQGYRPAWEDDRLNTKRAHQTLAGKAQMELRWTREVPRRLVDITTGRVVTSAYPDLVYPYTSLELQQRAGVAVASAQPRLKKGRLSTKSTSAQQPVVQQQVGGFRYVQVGTFGVEANARNSIARLQGLGLPVRVGKSQRSGKVLQTVVVGPFASATDLNSALATARRAGFRDAFLRK